MSQSQTQHNSGAGSLAPVYERLEVWFSRCLTQLKRVPLAAWQLLVKVLLLVWLAHTLAQVLWLWVPEPELPEARLAPNALTSEPGGAGRPSVDIAALSSLQVFGRVDQEALPDEVGAPAQETAGIEDEAVDTELSLVLRGVIGSNQDEAARAIIADGSTQQIYAPGDELPVRGKVTLEKILPLRVILSNNGRYESLWLYSDEKLRQGLAVQPPLDDRPGRSWEGPEEAGSDPEAGAETESDPEQRPDEAALEEASEQLGQRVGSQSLSDVVSMSIHREEGKIVGYRIRPGRDRSLFDSLGLETGDLVKAVNGSELSSPQRVMEIYRELGNARSASLLIERDGQELTIDIDLQ